MAPLRCFQPATSGTQHYSRPVRGTTRSLASTRSVQCQANLNRNDLAETQQHASRRQLLQHIALGATVAAVGQLPQQWPALADEAALAEAPSPAPALGPAAASTSGHQRVSLDTRFHIHTSDSSRPLPCNVANSTTGTLCSWQIQFCEANLPKIDVVYRRYTLT